jgi:hypothetical protein
MDGDKSLPHIGGIQSNERIHPVFRAMDRLGLDFLKCPFGPLLSKARNGGQDPTNCAGSPITHQKLSFKPN